MPFCVRIYVQNYVQKLIWTNCNLVFSWKLIAIQFWSNFESDLPHSSGGTLACFTRVITRVIWTFEIIVLISLENWKACSYEWTPLFQITRVIFVEFGTEVEFWYDSPGNLDYLVMWVNNQNHRYKFFRKLKGLHLWMNAIDSDHPGNYPENVRVPSTSEGISNDLNLRDATRKSKVEEYFIEQADRMKKIRAEIILTGVYWVKNCFWTSAVLVN